MPIAESLMKNLVTRYGEDRAKGVYYAMEASGKGPFGPGGKHRKLHEDWAAKNGVEPVGKKKPAGRKTRRAPKRR